MNAGSAPSARRLDARSLRALAHPLRMRILDLLAEGPGTATGLAERLGESSGTTSWHLRQLADHHFIAEDHERGNRRERWWRAAPDDIQLRLTDFVDDPDATGALDIVLHQSLADSFHRVAEWIAQKASWDRSWQRASDMWRWDLPLTADELRALNDELRAVVDRYRRERRAGDETVTILSHSFPRRRPGQS